MLLLTSALSLPSCDLLCACSGQDKVKYGASKALASALAPIVQPAEFIPAPKQPQPDSAPAPEAAPDAAVAGQPQPAAPALAPKDAEYYQLVAEGKAQQVMIRHA